MKTIKDVKMKNNLVYEEKSFECLELRKTIEYSNL